MDHPAEGGIALFVQRLKSRSLLNEDEIRAILALPHRKFEVPAKHEFVLIDEIVEHSSLVETGLVGRFGETVTGDRQIVAFHIPGDMPDLNASVRPVGLGGLVAICDTTLLRIPHRALRALVGRYPAIAEAFWRDTLLDAAILMQWLINVGRRDARVRLAHLLCEMSLRYGKDREVLLEYKFPITQAQLADALALTPVHLNRVLIYLRDGGLAKFKGGTVQIQAWKALADLGEFDPGYITTDIGPRPQARLLSDASASPSVTSAPAPVNVAD